MAFGSIVWRCGSCGNLTDRVCKCPKAKYHAVYRANGRQRWKAIGKSKKNAQKFLTGILSSIHSGTYQEIKTTPFPDFTQQWLDHTSSRVKARTLESYDGLIRLHLIPFFGKHLLTQITPQDIESFISHCMNKKGLSPRTTNYLLTVLKMLLAKARHWKLLRTDPAEEIRKLRQEREEMDYLKPQEVKILVEKADEPYRTLFLTAVLTGMRRGEILGLQWGDIDWNGGLIYVRRNLAWQSKRSKGSIQSGRRWYYSTPKTKRSTRAIIMSPELRKALQIHQINCPVSPYDAVFCTSTGNPLDPDNMVKNQFAPTLERAGLRRIRFHDLRHTYATLLISQGENVKFVQAQLGHESAKTTLDTYSHLMPENNQRSGAALDQQIFGSPLEDHGSNVLSTKPTLALIFR